MKANKRGRPRTFDKEQALEKAMGVFYEKGFEGASLDDLTAAMGINRPSLYAAFGNKEALFEEVLKCYTQPNLDHVRQVLFEAPTAKEAFQRILEMMVEVLSSARDNKAQMKGCLVTNSTVLACRESTQDLTSSLKSIHEAQQGLFYERLKRGAEAGEFSQTEDLHALAQYLNGVILGMGVLARAQQSEEVLQNIAKTAIRAIPDHPQH